MSPEPYTCALDPETNTTLKLYLFKNVQNVDTIRHHVTNGEWNCAIIKAALILHPFQVAVAANRAVLAHKHNSMITRTIYGEILYNLSLTKNISRSLVKFGVENKQDILVCFLVTAEKDESNDIIAKIEGERCEMSELSRFTDMKEVKSAYKLNNLKSNVDLLDIVVSRMVTKNFVSH